MSRSRRLPPRSRCPIGLALDLVGDAWSLLIVRDLMFKEFDTFKEFRLAGEGIATNILAERLERLEEAGIIGKRRDPMDARRYRYRLTEKGIDLAPMLIEMILWAARYEETDAPPATVAAMRSDPSGFVAELRRAWEADRSVD